MTSLEKFDVLMALDKKRSKVKITTINGEEYICKLCCFAEDEEDWAYDMITIDTPKKYLTLECNYIKTIEEL